MGYVVPEMPLKCNVYTGPWLSKVLRVADLDCNIALGRRVLAWAIYPYYESGVITQLLVPAGSDVRTIQNSFVIDIIEAPAGSGRWYFPLEVVDYGKGFANEHRAVFMEPASEGKYGSAWAGCWWPVPTP